MTKTTIFLTAQTSGTGSIQRILKTLSKGKAEYQQFFHDVVKNLPNKERTAAIPPKGNYVLTHNYPPAFNCDIDYSDYRFLVNYRDPRDRLCNVYAWQFAHGTSETEDVRLAREEKVRNMGIDAWVLEQISSDKGRDYFNNLFDVLENASEAYVASYAQLCCNFDLFIENLLKATKFNLNEADLGYLDTERPEKLHESKSWIGTKWAGSDTLPGRYKNELKYSTVILLNKYFSDTLKKMAQYDPYFKETYLEGL